MKAIKARVRRQLKAQAKSQTAFAAELGISKSHLSLILARKRRPSPQLAAQIENLTGIPFRELVGA